MLAGRLSGLLRFLLELCCWSADLLVDLMLGNDLLVDAQVELTRPEVKTVTPPMVRHAKPLNHKV